MEYVIGFIAVVVVCWQIYKIFTAKRDIDLTNPNPGRGTRRPDKPNEMNEK